MFLLVPLRGLCELDGHNDALRGDGLDERIEPRLDSTLVRRLAPAPLRARLFLIRIKRFRGEKFKRRPREGKSLTAITAIPILQAEARCDLLALLGIRPHNPL